MKSTSFNRDWYILSQGLIKPKKEDAELKKGSYISKLHFRILCKEMVKN